MFGENTGAPEVVVSAFSKQPTCLKAIEWAEV